MSLALAALTLILGFFFYKSWRSRRKASPDVARESTPALEAWIIETLESELAEGALGMKASTPEERRPLARALRGSPDPEIVTKVEEKVKAIELEFVRYSHEADAEITVRVRYENGHSGTSTKRLSWNEVPEAVRTDFDRRGSTRVFRTWALPWSRVSVL